MSNQTKLEALLKDAKIGGGDFGIGLILNPTSISKVATQLIGAGIILPPCRIGDKIYSIDKDLDSSELTIYENTITDIGQRYIYVSQFDPPKDDVGFSIPVEELGKRSFFSLKEAEKALKDMNELYDVMVS